MKKNLYTTPALPGEFTVARIADMARITADMARQRLSNGKTVAGHRWTRVGGEKDNKCIDHNGAVIDRRTLSRTRLTAPGYEGTVSYDDLQTLGRFQHRKTAVIYVSNGSPIAGRVWTRVNPRKKRERVAESTAAIEEAPAPKPLPAWHKPAAAPAPAPSAEPRRFAMAWESDVMAVNPMRLRAVPDAPTGVTL